MQHEVTMKMRAEFKVALMEASVITNAASIRLKQLVYTSYDDFSLEHQKLVASEEDAECSCSRLTCRPEILKALS